MYTIVAASQKGGSGKTTLSGHLAVEACRAGAGAVALIDTDPQGSLAAWWNARSAQTPHFVKVGSLDLRQALAQLQRSGFQIAIIDTPPAITQSISHVVAHADLVIVPTRPSPHDLRAVGATVDIAERFGKPLVFVVNAATARARITGESAVALSQHGTVAPVIVHHRVDFAASMIDGRTVGEILPNSASAREISDLWHYLQSKLSRVVQDPSLMPAITPEHMALRPLLAEADEDSEGLGDPDMPPIIPKLHGSQERRAGADRRVADLGPPAGGIQRRVHVFGRRRSDLVLGGGGK